MRNPILALLLLLSVLSVSAQYDPKALEILEAMSKKYKAIESFQADISQTLTNEVEKINEEMKGKITVKGEKFRLALPEQEIINDGTTQWTYLPDAKEVNIDTYDPTSDDVNPTSLRVTPSAFCLTSTSRPVKSPLGSFTIQPRFASYGVTVSSMSLP